MSWYGASSIREECSCGAKFSVTSVLAHVAADEWRRTHHHPSVGICGASSGTTFPKQSRCRLDAGHVGWHANKDGAHWGTEPETIPRTADRRARQDESEGAL